eukprot:1816272-Pleurochrysis_carterae.AAC.1
MERHLVGGDHAAHGAPEQAWPQRACGLAEWRKVRIDEVRLRRLVPSHGYKRQEGGPSSLLWSLGAIVDEYAGSRVLQCVELRIGVRLADAQQDSGAESAVGARVFGRLHRVAVVLGDGSRPGKRVALAEDRGAAPGGAPFPCREYSGRVGGGGTRRAQR